MKQKKAKKTSSSASKKGRCRVCCEPIRSGAAKCIHCGAYQDWTRHLLRWSALAVSLLAVAPLWGITTSLHKIAFSSKTANIEAALTSCDTNEITVAFTNSGELDGIVNEINFVLELDGKQRECSYEVRPIEALSDFVVSPNKPPVLVKYKAYIDNTEADFISGNYSHLTCYYVMKINWVDFRGNKKELTRKCACP